MDLLRDGHLVRLFNKTLQLDLCARPKNLDFFSLANKSVIFQDAVNRYGKTLSLPIIELSGNEALGLAVDAHEVDFSP